MQYYPLHPIYTCNSEENHGRNQKIFIEINKMYCSWCYDIEYWIRI